MQRTGLWIAAARAGALVLGLAACQSEEQEQEDGGFTDATSSIACTVDEECGSGKGCVEGYCAPCLEGAPCNEECQQGLSSEPPIIAGTNTWGLVGHLVSNAGMVSSLTTEARRCHWAQLNDRCTLINCLRSDWPEEASTLTGHSAGTVTIGNQRGRSEVFEPDPNGFYPFRQTVRWLAGDQITVEASGDEIPAFRRTYLFPSTVTVTSAMAEADGSLLAIDSSHSFVATWAPFPGSVLVSFAQGLPYDDMDFQELTCEFDAATGRGLISVPVLQHLKLDPSLRTGFGIANHVSRCFKVGEFHARTRAASGHWRDVTLCNGTLGRSCGP